MARVLDVSPGGLHRSRAARSIPVNVADLGSEAALVRPCCVLEPRAELAVDEDSHRRRALLLVYYHAGYSASLPERLEEALERKE